MLLFLIPHFIQIPMNEIKHFVQDGTYPFRRQRTHSCNSQDSFVSLCNDLPYSPFGPSVLDAKNSVPHLHHDSYTHHSLWIQKCTTTRK